MEPRTAAMEERLQPEATEMVVAQAAGGDAASDRGSAVRWRSKAGAGASARDGGPALHFGLLFSLSMASGFVNCLLWPLAGIGPGPESLNLARSLTAHGTFADPYHALPTGFSAHMAPLYPLFMAALLRLFGDATLFSVLLYAWNIVAQALFTGMLPALSRALFGSTRPGIVASALFIVFPLNLIWAQWEAITVCAGFALFCLATRGLAASPLRADLLTGGAAGVLMLFSPTIATPCFAWAAFAMHGASGRRVLRLVLAGGSALVFICLPWTVRNYARFHTLIPLRDNFGLELYVSNRDGAGPTYIENLSRDVNMPHPNSNVEEAKQVRELGEAGYNRVRQTTAIRWIFDHPREFASLTALRIARFWFPLPDPVPFSSWCVWAVTALSVAGLAMLAARKSAALWFLGPALALYPLPYYVTNNDARYRYPVLWLSALCAGYALAAAWDKFHRASPAAP